MYYEEKMIDGVLYSRSTPKGEWQLVSPAQLTSLLLQARGRVKELEDAHYQHNVLCQGENRL